MERETKHPVTVIVPVYNGERYLQQCLDSLVNQTLKDIEVLVIESGSTDGSGDLIDKYAGSFECVTAVHLPYCSQAHKMNVGARMAKGEYIAECDCDDYASPVMYEHLYRAAEGKADAVRCGFFGQWDNGRQQMNALNVPKEYLRVDPHKLQGVEKAIVFGKMCLLPTGIYRREFILENELFWREDGQNYEDTSVEFKIKASAKDYRFVNECLYYYRRGNPGSGSATIFDNFAICEQYDEIERFNDHNGYDFMDYINALRYYSYMWSLARTPRDKMGEVLMRMQSDFIHHPAKRDFFNTDEDFRNYCLIKYGAWVETGVPVA